MVGGEEEGRRKVEGRRGEGRGRGGGWEEGRRKA